MTLNHSRSGEYGNQMDQIERLEGREVMTLNTISDNTVKEVPAGTVDGLYALTPEEFAAKSVKERDTVLFQLLCDLAAEVKELRFKVADYEEKGRAMMSPEGIQELTGKLMGGIGGGMFGGLLG